MPKSNKENRTRASRKLRISDVVRYEPSISQMDSQIGAGNVGYLRPPLLENGVIVKRDPDYLLRDAALHRYVVVFPPIIGMFLVDEDDLVLVLEASDE